MLCSHPFQRALAALAFVAVLGIGIALPGFAQSNRFDVTGVVTDSTDVGLAGATVVVLQEADSVLVSFSVTRDDGAFRLRRVPAGRFILQVTFVGFAPYSKPVEVIDEDLDVGRIHLREGVAALDELVINAEHIPMVVKADTLEYNAAAFQVRPNANVEELLKRLPGVEVERDGSIKAQGETVERVLVDGKEFFGNDPTIATRNLPADAVDRVQVYDKQSDMAEFTGVDDGEESKTINLALKEDKKKGYFGNVSGGFGGAAPYDHAARYDGKATINRFSPSTQLSFIGNANNVNRQGFAVNDYISFMGGMQAVMAGGRGISFGGGVPLGTNLSDGFTTTLSGGLNFNHEFGSKTDFRSSYFINHVDNEQDRTVQQQQLFGAALSSLVQQEANQTSRNFNHRLNLNVQHEIGEGHDVRLQANAQASDAALDNLSQRETLGADNVLENASNTTYASDSKTLSGDAALTYRKRLGGGRSLVAELRSNLNDSDQEGNLHALNRFYREGNLLTTEEIAQLQSQLSNTFTHTERLSYTEPLGKKRALQFDVEHRGTSEDQDKTVFDEAAGGLVRNDLLSSAFERTYTYNKGGINYRDNRDPLSFGIGVDVQQSNLNGDLLDLNTTIDHRFVHLLPSASVSYTISNGKNLDLRYNASTREPSLRDLQPVADNSDPLNIYVGNPELSPEYSHSVNLRFTLFDQFTFTNLFAFARATYTSNTIARARTIDEQLRQTVTPVNTDGDWSLSGNVSFGTPIRRLRSKINLSTNTLFNRGIEFINGDENETQILRSTVNLRLENRNKEVIDAQVGARYTFNVVSYSLNEHLDQSYVNRTFYAELTYNLHDVWRFSTSLDYNLYSEEVFGAGQDIPLWEAEVSRSLLNNQAQIQLVALDLLDRNVGVNYSNTNTYIQEERISALGRYLMLRFVYNLSGVGNQGPRIEMVRD